MADELNAKNTRSLFTLIRDLPGLLVALLKAELAQLRAELTRKAIHAGIGIGMFAVAGVLVFFMLGVLVAAAVLGLAVVFPGWLAALLVAALLLILAVVLALLGVRWFKKSMPPVPTTTLASVKEDVQAIKGVGRYDR